MAAAGFPINEDGEDIKGDFEVLDVHIWREEDVVEDAVEDNDSTCIIIMVQDL